MEENRIKISSGKFRGNNLCITKRYGQEFFPELKSDGGVNVDLAIAGNDIIKMYFKGEADITEVKDLVGQGLCGADKITEETFNQVRDHKAMDLERLFTSETRRDKLIFPEGKEIPYGIYDVWVHPTYIVYNDGGTELEVVMVRHGKPDVKEKGRTKDTAPDKCIEMYLLIQYGKTLLTEDDKVTRIKASYYYLRKDTDKRNAPRDNDFFSGQGGNIVSLIQDVSYYTKDNYTQLDDDFKKLHDEYVEGVTHCDEKNCKYCMFNNACHYVVPPEVIEEGHEAKAITKPNPSEEQRAIIEHDNGECRVIATAGSGKTFCLAWNVVSLLKKGADIKEIFISTFSEAAALEIKKRIISYCQVEDIPVSADEIYAVTFHKFDYDIIKMEDNWKKLGFTKCPKPIDEVRQSNIIAQLLDEVTISTLNYENFTMEDGGYGALDVTLKVFNIIKELNVNLDNPDVKDKILEALRDKGLSKYVDAGAFEELLDLYQDYCERLKEENIILYSDMEQMADSFLEENKGYLEKFGFKHLIIDEAQDSNEPQLRMIKRLMECSTYKSMMFMGDDSQSIYGFRNTTPEYIRELKEKLNISELKDLSLSKNRRCTPQIVEAAKSLIELNENRLDKPMESTRDNGKVVSVQEFFNIQEEYEDIVAKILKSKAENNRSFGDFAILARTNNELPKIAEVLTRENIPFVFKNPMKLKDDSNVKAAIAISKAFYEPESTLLYFNYLVAVYKGKILDTNPEEVKAKIDELQRLFKFADSMEISEARRMYHELLDAIGENDEIYKYFLSLVYDNEDIQSELEYIRAFERYGSKVARKMDQNYGDRVVLTTCHSSKGLEWPVVFVILDKFDNKFCHGNSPAKNAEREETRRLLFVAMTRARDELYITGNYAIGGNEKDGYEFNQFLVELYEIKGQHFITTDPMKAVRDAEKKRKAREKAALKRQYSAGVASYPKNLKGQLTMKF